MGKRSKRVMANRRNWSMTEKRAKIKRSEPPKRTPVNVEAVRLGDPNGLGGIFYKNGRLNVNWNEVENITLIKFGANKDTDLRIQIEMKKGKKWNAVVEYLKKEEKHQDIYMNLEEVADIKILIGGTTVQEIHHDFEFREDVKARAESLPSKACSALFCCNEENPVRLAVSANCLNNNAKWDWDEVKSNFVREATKGPRTRARVNEQESDAFGRYGVFICAGIVFSQDVAHAGMPVQRVGGGRHEKGGMDSAAMRKLLEGQEKAGDLKFLRSIDDLDRVSRVFVTVWPKDMGKKDKMVAPDTVGIAADTNC